VRRGDTDQALERCQTLVSGQPWHLNAYLAGAMIAIHLDEPLVAEEMARIGSHYFPEEGLLLWYLGVARTLQGRFGDAEQALRDAITLCPECTGARGALLRLLLNQGRIRDAISVLEERPRNGLDQEGVEPALDNLSYWLRWRGPGMAFGMAIAVVGVVLLPVVTIAGAGLVALGATCAGGVFFIAGQKARAWMLRPSVEDLSVGIKRLQRRMRERPRIS